MSHEITLLLLSQLALLLGVARILGEWMRRLDQPAVVGELLAGLLVGPSVLGWLAPSAYAAVFPKDPHLVDMLSAFSLVGVLMLLIVTGLEIDINLISRKIRTATAASLGGLLVPFALGLGLGMVLPDSYLVQPHHRLVLCLFLAVNLSISAIPVIAKILMDLKAIRRDIGQITLAAAMIDDAVGWVLLSVAAGLASHGRVTLWDVGYSLIASILVMGLGLKWGRNLVHQYLGKVERWTQGESPQLAAVLFLALAFSILTHGIGLESMLGAFLAGILLGQSPRLKSQVTHSLEVFTASFFAPLFFASAGLKVNLSALATPSLLGLLALVMVVACLGKYLGCYIGGWAGGLGHWERLTLGSGMNPRGAMGVIVARIGLSLGILNEDLYTVMISMAILTSLLAPPLLRYTLARVQASPEELQRMNSDSQADKSFLESLKKVLLPSRGGHNVPVAAHLLGHLSHDHPLKITALLTHSQDQPPADLAVQALAEQLKRTQGPGLAVRRVVSDNPSEAILAEAENGNYDLVVIGASRLEGPSQGHPVTQNVLSRATCATMIVRAHPDFTSHEDVVVIERVLLPVVGTQYCLRATELAAVICRSLGATMTIIHVVPPLDGDSHGPHAHEIALTFARNIVDHHADVARGLGAQVDTEVLEHPSPSQAILTTAKNYDLIFMGNGYRPVGGKAFLGHRSENVIRNAPCAVAVLSSG